MADDLAAFLARHARPYDPAADDYRRPPFAAPVKASKATPIYNAHSYHTKVPPQGITPYIQHYTNPGDLVLDPFCGSGMTGVAALMSGRNALLNDLSPAATHIAYNYCTPVDVAALKAEFARIKEAVKEEFDWLYGTTCERCGGPATIQYTIWSDVLACGRCGADLMLWEVAVERESGAVRETFTCPTCGKEQTKRQARWLRSVPVVTNYECHGNCRTKRAEHPTTEAERQHTAEIERKTTPYWYPTDKLDPTSEMYIRCNLGNREIHRVHQFYTSRNLWALARLWDEIGRTSDTRITERLRFAFTASLQNSTRMYKYRANRKGGILSGTLFIPSLNCELNVGELFARKATDSMFGYGSVDSTVCCSTGSATELRDIPESTVDYVFTDPPFGMNLYYADLNFMWEAWLRKFTDPTDEAVVNREKKIDAKTVADYARLMAESFREMHRVLKPGRWASVVFHNSDDRIWQVILDAAVSAGFELAEVNSFDKQQLSFKGIRGAKGVERVTNKDIVLNLRKPRPGEHAAPNGETHTDLPAQAGQQEVRIVAAIAAFLETNPPPEERALQGLWNHALYGMLRDGAVTFSMAQVEELLPHYFKQVEGRWYLRGEQVLEGGLGMIVEDEASAIAWLSRVLANEPQTTGDLIPQWQAATRDARIAKPLDQILAENFWPDERSGRWRTPSDAERRRMSAQGEVAALAQLRVVRRYLEGRLDRRPGDAELCAWVRFCYSREFYAEAAALFAQVDESRVDAEEYRSVRKIAEVCRMKA